MYVLVQPLLRCQGVHVRCSWASRVVRKVIEGHRGSSRVIEGHRGVIEHRGIETSRGLMSDAHDHRENRHRGSSLASSSIEPYIEPTSSLYVEPSRPGLSARRRRLAAIAAAIAIACLSNPPCRAPSPPSPFPTSPATAALAASCKQRREGAARESGPSERREAVARGSGTRQRREAHLQCQRCGWACLHVRRFSSKTALSALKTQKFSRQQAHVTGPDE